MPEAWSELAELAKLTIQLWLAALAIRGATKFWRKVRSIAQLKVATFRAAVREWLLLAWAWTIFYMPGHPLAGTDISLIRSSLNFPQGGNATEPEFPHILRTARGKVEDFRNNCSQLNVPLPPRARVSRALFRRIAAHNRRSNWLIFGFMASLIWAPRTARIIWAAAADLFERLHEILLEGDLIGRITSRLSESSNKELTDSLANAGGTIIIVWIIAPFAFLLMAWPFIVTWAAFSGRRALLGIEFRSAVDYRRYALVQSVTAAVSACAEAHSATDLKRPDALRSLGIRLANVEQHILKAYRTSGALHSRSHLHKEARKHGEKVALRLRAAGNDLISENTGSNTQDGTSQSDTPQSIAALLIGIADRYTTGSIGALLNAEDLKETSSEHFGPVRNSQRLSRTVILVILWALGAWGIASLGLPGIAEPVALLSVIIISTILVHGRHWRDILQFFPYAPLS
ncbi:hypothetical protein ACGFX7_12605 [Streptomyces harbinensis]|uniref:hypothetical protein n=1 Tax=Streptomyces harbinensis TaxID=1176198 RepID=UPI00371A469E